MLLSKLVVLLMSKLLINHYLSLHQHFNILHAFSILTVQSDPVASWQ